MQKCCLPREAANSTVLGGLVIAPSCPAEITKELYPVWVGFLFSSRTGRQLQDSMCNDLPLGCFPRLHCLDCEHPRCFWSVSTKGLSQQGSAVDPLKVKGPTGCHGTILRPSLFFASCQSEFSFESSFGTAWAMGCVVWLSEKHKSQLSMLVCTTYSSAGKILLWVPTWLL